MVVERHEPERLLGRGEHDPRADRREAHEDHRAERGQEHVAGGHVRRIPREEHGQGAETEQRHAQHAQDDEKQRAQGRCQGPGDQALPSRRLTSRTAQTPSSSRPHPTAAMTRNRPSVRRGRPGSPSWSFAATIAGTSEGCAPRSRGR